MIFLLNMSEQDQQIDSIRLEEARGTITKINKATDSLDLIAKSLKEL
jgi:hypothetical protein